MAIFVVRNRALVVAVLLSASLHVVAARGQSIVDLATIRPLILNHFESLRVTSQPYGAYKMQATDTGLSYYASLDVNISRTIMGETHVAAR